MIGRKSARKRALGMFGILNRIMAYAEARKGRSPSRLSSSKDIDRKALWRMRRVDADTDKDS